jgi:long-chain fatty acid transport protein
MGAGFSIFEQGAKAMGMAGAFTAQADDGSAMFHNIAGIAFTEDTLIQGGLTVIAVKGTQFQGFDPFPGSSASSEMNDLTFFPLHGYYLKRLNKSLTFGLGANSPFGLATQWLDNDNFSGRFISLRAELITLDINAGLGWKVNDNFSLGLGAIVRFSQLELLRRVPVINPATFTATDSASALLESDLEQGFGWNAGLLHKVNNRFSWGFTYHSEIEVEYDGDAQFTQIATGNPVLDALVAGNIPFGQEVPISTAIDFPDQAILGVAIGLTNRLLVEVDYGWTGWSSFDQLFTFFKC